MIVSQEQQRSDAWYALRRGLPTASRFDAILTPKTAEPSKAQDSLINELIAESIQPPEQGFIRHYISPEMEQGMKLEGEARCSFELEYAKGQPVKEVGFIMHDCGLFGGSPDALVGDDSGLELKVPNLSTHIGYVRAGALPPEYRCQVHGSMIVTGRNSWWFFSYARGALPFTILVKKDDFTKKLEDELYVFCSKYNEARKLFGLQPIGI